MATDKGEKAEGGRERDRNMTNYWSNSVSPKTLAPMHYRAAR